ncbi:MAG: arabinan endo-1,5-alpha-L-arabinosidase [Phycisphaerae bacterium]|nr:arabinan endo-1,5-alpha-L-arabinosidase [Phycisphaerae bacterium]
MHGWNMWLTALLGLLFVGGSAHAQQGEVRGVHDPVMIRSDGTWYVFSTGAGVQVRRSSDLLNWERVGRVFEEDVPAWAHKEVAGARDIWAPDISYYNGRFHLYYSVSTMGSQRSCIGLATNKTLDPTSPEYKWEDRGKVIESFPDKMDFNTIDPSLALDKQGQPWLVWGSFWGGIKLVQLNPDTGKPAEGAPIHNLAARPRRHAIEAPILTHHGDYYYLFVSFDHCCRGVASNYHIMVGRSREITGPYVDFHGRPMLEGNGTLVLAGYGEWRGPGHNGLCRDGDRDWLVHHMYDAAERGMRTMQIRPLIWTDDGWPVVGEPITTATLAPRKLKPEDLVGVWRHSVDFGAESYHEFHREGRMNSAVDRATWSLSNSALELRWPAPEAPGGAWVDKCYVSPNGMSYVGRNQSGLVVRGARYVVTKRGSGGE